MTRVLRRVGVGFTLMALWSVILRAASSGPKDLSPSHSCLPF